LHYNLHPAPFRLTPDPGFFFVSQSHKRAIAYLNFVTQQQEGLVIITGPPGTGKTALMLNFLSKLPASHFTYTTLVSPHVAAYDFLLLINAAFHLPFEHCNKATLLKHLESFLIAQAKLEKQVLLVIDEAHNLLTSALNELSLLTNFQQNGLPLLQCILLGQETLIHHINNPALVHLKQRVIATTHLEPLNLLETQHYIEHRLQLSHWHGDPMVNASAYQLIHTFSEGIPRKINLICQRILLQADIDELHTIDAQLVWSIIRELQDETIIESDYPNPVMTHKSIVRFPNVRQALTQEKNLLPPLDASVALGQIKHKSNNDPIKNHETSIQTRHILETDVSHRKMNPGNSKSTITLVDTRPPINALVKDFSPSMPEAVSSNQTDMPPLAALGKKNQKYIDNTVSRHQHTEQQRGSGFMDKELRSFAAMYEKQLANQPTANNSTQTEQQYCAQRDNRLPKNVQSVASKRWRYLDNQTLKQALFWGIPLLLVFVVLNLGYTDKYQKKTQSLLSPAGLSAKLPEDQYETADIRVKVAPTEANSHEQASSRQETPEFFIAPAPTLLTKTQTTAQATIQTITSQANADSEGDISPPFALVGEKLQLTANNETFRETPIIANNNINRDSTQHSTQPLANNTATVSAAPSLPVDKSKQIIKDKVQPKPSSNKLDTLPYSTLTAVPKPEKVTTNTPTATPKKSEQPLQLQNAVIEHTVIEPQASPKVLQGSPVSEYSQSTNAQPNKDQPTIAVRVQTLQTKAQPGSVQHAMEPDNQAPPAIPTRELDALLSTLTHAYENGNIIQLVSMFSNDFKSKTAATRAEIENDYQRLFNITDMRRMQLRKTNWSESNNIMRGEAVFHIKIREKGDSRIAAYKGILRLDVEKSASGALIKNLDYLYSTSE